MKSVLPKAHPSRPQALADERDFDCAIRPHLQVLTLVARRFAPAADADDVVQNALLSAWRARDRFDPQRGTLRAWLVAITVNESRRAQSGWNRRLALLARYAHLSPPDVDQRTDDDPALMAAIARLSARQRQVIDLHYFADLPVDEVAAALEISVGTVKSTLFDARRRLRDLLATSASAVSGTPRAFADDD